MVAGETSGDYLAAQLLRPLRERLPQLSAEGIGGNQMKAEAFTSLFAMDRLAVMGLLEPLRRLPELLRIRRQLGEHFLSSPPDVFVGVDAPDFNLQLETKLRAAGIPVAHYVSPSIWAWRRGRLKTIARAADCVLCLLPFEVGVYRATGIQARFVGHPLAWQIPLQPDHAQCSATRTEMGLSEGQQLVAMMPGSRASEVRHNLPTLLATARRLHQSSPGMAFAIPAASPLRHRQIVEMVRTAPELASLAVLPPPLAHEGAQQRGLLMAAADLALVVLGTATLEVMLHKTPMVTLYRTGALNYQLLRRLVNIDTYALPNLLAGERIVPELVQSEASPQHLATAALELLNADNSQLLERFQSLHLLMRGESPSVAAEAVAELAGWNL